MKALVVQENTKIAIVDIDEPIAGNGQVRVKLKAASINKRDYWISIGKYPGIKAGVTLGSDGAGIIDQVGSGVSKTLQQKSVIINPNINWGSNPQVQAKEYNILGMPRNGTFAEYVIVNADRIINMPNHLDYDAAASLPLAGLTAYRACFNHGKLKKDNKVLISGFGGGVAHFAFKFAKALNTKVSVTSGSKVSLQKAQELGAVHGFNYLDEDWIQQASDKAGGFDLIIDSAGGDQFNDLIKILNPAGKIVFYGASNGLPTSLDLYRLFWKQGTIQGSTMGNDLEFDKMVNFIENYKIEPIISQWYPFEQFVIAIKQMGEAGEVGKTVVVF